MKDFKSRAEAIASFVYAKSHKEYSTLANTIDSSLASAYAEGRGSGLDEAIKLADWFYKSASMYESELMKARARESGAIARDLRVLKETEHGK